MHPKLQKNEKARKTKKTSASAAMAAAATGAEYKASVTPSQTRSRRKISAPRSRWLEYDDDDEQ